ncbi:MAG TPA: fatty acid desaturase [Bacteroidia bacterium]|nr:fatty acid desaturase [Bacteroidia bacterium]
MLQGRALILATKPFAQENRAKSWYYTISTYLLLIACFVGIALLPWLPAKLAVSVFTGFIIMRMFVIYHDHQHHAILNNSVLANILFRIFGIFILAPSSIWKRSHDYHHANNSKLYTASIGSYPIMTKEKFMNSTKAERNAYLAIRHPMTILMGYFSTFIFGMSIKSFLSSPRRHFDSLIALFIHFSAYFLLIWYGHWYTPLLLITIPFLIACCLGSYLFYAQHNFPGVEFADKSGWTYELAALQSSSYMTMNRFMQWASANIGYHHIHHMNARIPFYRLPEVMEKIPELSHPKTTSLKPRDILACISLKVWDPESKEMIPVSGI